MHELTIERTFCAAHAIAIRGRREPVHGHNWLVRATVAGEALDADGLLCDFHDLERALETIIAPFHNRDLNATPPFDSTNPTAERVAEYIGRELMKALPPNVRLESLSVTEAPGCVATFRPWPDRRSR